MAANQSSPGVVVQERDLTTITTLSTANVGVLAAPFELGPVEEVIDISNESLSIIGSDAKELKTNQNKTTIMKPSLSLRSVLT